MHQFSLQFILNSQNGATAGVPWVLDPHMYTDTQTLLMQVTLMCFASPVILGFFMSATSCLRQLSMKAGGSRGQMG